MSSLKKTLFERINATNLVRRYKIFIFVLVAVLVLVILLAALSDAFSSTAASITIAGITIFGGLATQAFSNAFQRQQEIEARQRESKIKVYENFMSLYFDKILGSVKTGKQANQQDLQKHLSRLTRDMILWGSDEVLKNYQSFYLTSKSMGESKGPIDLMIEMERVFYAFRRDLGYENHELGEGDLLSLFVNDIDAKKNVP